MDKARIIKVLDAQSGRFTEQEIDSRPVEVRESDIPYPRDAKGRMTVNHENVALTESPGVASTANFPDLLRMGVQFDAFTSYAETPTTYQQFVRVVDSNKQQEEYLKDAGIGLLPIVNEGQPYPEAAIDLNDGVTVANYKRGYIVSITEEMQKFDQLGKVRQIAESMGRAGRLGEEQDVMVELTNTAKYTRAGNTGDNDETAVGNGANTQSLTFSPEALIAAFNILRTMKDRKSGQYLNVMPNTLVLAPKLWWAARQLIGSPDLWGQGDADATVVYGQGTKNSFFNVVSTIIVSPIFGNGFQWALMEAGRGMRFQRVEPLQILQEGMNAASEKYLTRDVIRYRIRNWYGVGMIDDRFNFYSSSTTKPTIN